MNKKVFIILIALSLINLALADLPVHCVKNQIAGNWEFRTSKILAKKGESLSCGHDVPDKPDTSYRAALDGIGQGEARKLQLDMGDMVQDLSSSQMNSGSWTMIYDEGFEVTIDNYKYFAFSKYFQDEHGSYKSQCSFTLTGWYENIQTGEKGCMLGQKTDGKAQVSENVRQDKVVQPKEFISQKTTKKVSEKVDINEDNNIAQSSSSTKQYNYLPGKDGSDYTPRNNNKRKDFNFLETDIAFAQTGSKTETTTETESSDVIHIHKDYKDHQQIVDRLNKIKKSWVAKVPENFKELSLSEMNSRAGRKKYNGISSAVPSVSNSKQEQKKQESYKSFLQTTMKTSDDEYQHYSRSDVSDLPKEFTWANEINKPIQQRDCGSCYTIATAEMISARLKIKYNENVMISAQHLLDCNYYNQGCDGGYPYLVNKFASEIEMVPESCKPYRATDGMCSDMCDKSQLPKTYLVKDYKYIGGAYGKSNEREMMLEIQQNGPIVVSFEPGYDFMYYSSGIYHAVDAQEWIKNRESQPSWEKVDHSVLCYGWGETIDGEKYWMVLNSWGSQWGEEGTFKMRRGTDESHIESMGEAAEPYVINRGGNSFVGLTSQESSNSFKKTK